MSAFAGLTRLIKNDFIGNRAGSGQVSFGRGGGVYLQSGTSSRATPREMLIVGGTFQNNIANRFGGAIAVNRNAAEVTVMIRSASGGDGATQFIGNRALRFDGGGIFSEGIVNVRDAIFSENQARSGAGIYANTGTLTLVGAQVTDNEARQDGGGLYISSVSDVTHDAFFENNMARNGPDIFEEV